MPGLAAAQDKRRIVRRAGLFAATLPCAPALAALTLQGMARLAGCTPSGGSCTIAGAELGPLLTRTLDAAWSIAVSVPLLALAVLFALGAMHIAARGGRERAVFGMLTPLVLPAAVLILPILAVHAGLPAACTPNEAGGPCVAYGHDMGMTYHGAAMAPWLLVLYLPAGLAAGLVYAAALALARHRRRTGTLEAPVHTPL